MNNQEFKTEQPAEFFFRQPCVAHDAGQSECVDRMVPGDSENTNAICYYDVLALARDVETCFFKRSNRSQVVDSGESGPTSADLDFANVRVTHEIIAYQQIFLYRFANIVDSFNFRSALRPASGKARYGYAVSRTTPFERNFLFLLRNPPDGSRVRGSGASHFAGRNFIKHLLPTSSEGLARW